MLEANKRGYTNLERILEKRIHQIVVHFSLDEDKTLRTIYESSGLIATVKEHRTRSGCDLLESKRYIENMAGRFNWNRP
jgi:hypothetical protein